MFIKLMGCAFGEKNFHLSIIKNFKKKSNWKIKKKPRTRVMIEIQFAYIGTLIVIK